MLLKGGIIESKPPDKGAIRHSSVTLQQRYHLSGQAVGGDLVERGIVASLAQPDGNITGQIILTA